MQKKEEKKNYEIIELCVVTNSYDSLKCFTRIKGNVFFLFLFYILKKYFFSIEFFVQHFDQIVNYRNCRENIFKINKLFEIFILISFFH